MNVESLQKLLESVRSGTKSVDAALAELRHLPFEELGFATLDHHRACGAGSPR